MSSDQQPNNTGRTAADISMGMLTDQQAPRPPSASHHSPDTPRAPFPPTFPPSNAPLPPTYGAQPQSQPPNPQPAYPPQPQQSQTYNLTPEAYQLHARALTGDVGKSDSGRQGQTATSSNAHLSATQSASHRLPGGFVDYEKPPPGSEAEVREYLNDKVMPHILNGLKVLARERPADPLKALGEFLIEQSKK